MKVNQRTIFMGDSARKPAEKSVEGQALTWLGEPFYKITNYDAIEPFFMSIVSSSDHWMFISSTGGLTAGRVNAEQAIFPYYTVDRVSENSENTGPKAILLVECSERTSLWEPFSERQRGVYAIQRSLYKNISGTVLIFEEQNRDLGLVFRYAWRTSEQFGFVKTSWLANHGTAPARVELLDGIQNILPANVTPQTQNTFSCLLDAYKRSETEPVSGLGIFALNATMTDLAEPSESLQATTVMQVGLEGAQALLSSTQLEAFRAGEPVAPEAEIRGQRCAYFAHASLDLAPGQERAWHLLIDVQQDGAAIAQKLHWLQGGGKADLVRQVEADIAAGEQSLWKIVASADGIQQSASPSYPAYHFANVMFNLMRGGIFTEQYWINQVDLVDFISARNRPALAAHSAFFAGLPAKIHLTELLSRAQSSGSAELLRLCYAYLPLSFSRRHGDPSRPWNQFAIKIKKPDGSLKIDYEGNWRDIFQNWEALAYAYPEFIESMITTFLNATTLDGYNPYRITHHGIDWEVPEPGNPWANIGYWSDHQVIYLQKLMEISLSLHPGRLADFLDRPLFSYASVPYRLKPYAELLKDPYNTIDFDWNLHRQIAARLPGTGTDAKLVLNPQGQVLQVSLAEKLLTLLLAKLVNFVPEGGIWMNTQRPEWNDANNALVGKGISVVTLCYLRRMLAFCRELFARSGLETVSLSQEVYGLFVQIAAILDQFRGTLGGSFSDVGRRQMMDALGEAGSAYRWNYYQNGLSGAQTPARVSEILAFLELAQQYAEHTLRANRRADALYHSYNVLQLSPNCAAVDTLYEMLEGQVAILSSGLLTGAESLALLTSLRHSALYQPSQRSYILYPDREVKGFLAKNTLTPAQVAQVPLLASLAEAQDGALVVRDVLGAYHWNGQFRNFKNVSHTLERLQGDPRYAALVAADTEKIKALFEETFHHNQFTGRSSTFFAYEGLGSVYWHMVAKLQLAAQETALRCRREPQAAELLACYADIRQGMSFNKTPAEYGAFPSDPYSHTPKGQGAKQPGMTGMVKEVILARLAELGLSVENGQIRFDPLLLDRAEFLGAPANFSCLDVHGRTQEIALQPGTLAYSFCQVPVVLAQGAESGITVQYADGRVAQIQGNALDEATSRHIFLRDGKIRQLTVAIPGS
jgi:hypothetical protein